MSIASLKKPSIIALSVILLIFATLLVAADVRKSHWQSISWVTPSPDGRKLTATFVMNKLDDDDRFCWQVTDTEVQESSSQVIIGIQVSNPCAPLLSWGTVKMPDNGYMHKEDLLLNAPLNGRTIIEKESRQEITVKQSDGD